MWFLIALALLVFGTTAAALAAIPGPRMGPTSRVFRPAFHGFYDGHKDTYLSTDVSDKAQAAQMHVNFSAALASVPMKATPEMYFVSGPAAPNQLAVFASEPGESNYSPLWHEVFVSFASGTTPVLLTSDTQIEDLIKSGGLVEHHTHIVLNCPIVKVGK
jgi:hypothetical protein